MSGWRIDILLLVFLAAVSCQRTAPQKPSQRSSETPSVDTTMMALMEMNQRMAGQADMTLLELTDSLHQADGSEWVQLTSGGWKMRRNAAAQQQGLYADNPQPKEVWRVRVRMKHLDGRLAKDTECAYTIKSYKLPISVEEALEDMYSGEKSVVLAPWYCAYGFSGNDLIAPYENVIFEIDLGEKQ